MKINKLNPIYSHDKGFIFEIKFVKRYLNLD
jgi:hypothetical protein